MCSYFCGLDKHLCPLRATSSSNIKSFYLLLIFAGRRVSTSKDDVVGVVQAINKIDRNSSNILPFDAEDEKTLAALCGELGRVLKQNQMDAIYYNAVTYDVASDSSEMSASIIESFIPERAMMSPSSARSPTLQRSGPTLGPSKFSVPEISPSLVKEFSVNLHDQDFDALEKSDASLIQLILTMFQEFQLLARFHIQQDVLLRFLTKCSEQYLPNPYHNFKHAYTVTHFVYLMFASTVAKRYVGYLEIFAGLVAAVGHDIDHPGVNNDYMIKVKDPRYLNC
jgi:hypothetical protein